jgi:hypothetical protein
MSAGLDVDIFGNKGGETTRQCSVVAIYEDLGSRQLLLQLSDSLARKFKNEVEFQFDWCRFKYLTDPDIAREAAHHATRADLILLAPKSPNLPVYVQGWFEGWLPNREGAEGALVLVQPSRKGAARSLPLQSLQTYLRLTAKRARLDYLRLNSPASSAGAVAGMSLSQFAMDELLARDSRPVDWGINE